MAFLLTPNDQEKYFDSIENKFPNRRWNNYVVDVSWFNQYYANSGSEHPWHCHATNVRESNQKNICS